jgi:hypothetical protein
MGLDARNAYRDTQKYPEVKKNSVALYITNFAHHERLLDFFQFGMVLAKTTLKVQVAIKVVAGELLLVVICIFIAKNGKF